MQQELQSNDSPLDAHLQAVLPGVHHPFEIQRQAIVGLRGDVGHLSTAVETNSQVFTEKLTTLLR